MLFEELKKVYDEYKLPYKVVIYTSFLRHNFVTDFNMKILGEGQGFSIKFPSLVFRNSNYIIRIKNKKYFKLHYLDLYLLDRNNRKIYNSFKIIHNSFVTELISHQKDSYNYYAYYTIRFNFEKTISKKVRMCLYYNGKIVLQSNNFNIL